MSQILWKKIIVIIYFIDKYKQIGTVETVMHSCLDTS